MGISKSLLMLALIALAIGVAKADENKAEENFESWRLHTPTFPSTGGGGVIIGEYNPVTAGDKCTTDFTATLPDGKVFYNSVEFDAVPAQGGTLCTNGRWRAKDGTANGTTPYRVFFKDDMVRGSP